MSAIIVNQLTPATVKKEGIGKTGRPWRLYEWKADLTFPAGDTISAATCKAFMDGDHALLVPGSAYLCEQASREDYTSPKTGRTTTSYKIEFGGSGPVAYGATAKTAPATAGGPVPGYTSGPQQVAATAAKSARPSFEEAVRWMLAANAALGTEPTPEQATSLFIAVNNGSVLPPISEEAQKVLAALGGTVVHREPDGDIPF